MRSFSNKKVKDKRINKISEMDDQLFIQRRRIINMLYEVRNELKIELPYITVRIADFKKENLLGLGFFKKNQIVISDKVSQWSDDYLRHIVYHELAHAYFNAPHDESCKLMPAIVPKNIGAKSELLSVLKKISVKFYKKNNCSELVLVN